MGRSKIGTSPLSLAKLSLSVTSRCSSKQWLWGKFARRWQSASPPRSAVQIGFWMGRVQADAVSHSPLRPSCRWREQHSQEVGEDKAALVRLRQVVGMQIGMGERIGHVEVSLRVCDGNDKAWSFVAQSLRKVFIKILNEDDSVKLVVSIFCGCPIVVAPLTRGIPVSEVVI